MVVGSWALFSPQGKKTLFRNQRTTCLGFPNFFFWPLVSKEKNAIGLLGEVLDSLRFEPSRAVSYVRVAHNIHNFEEP